MPRKCFCFLSLLLFYCFLILLSFPARSAERMTLDAYIDQALSHSPRAAAILADVKNMEAHATEAGRHENPTVQADITAVRNGTGQELALELEQPLRGSDFGSRAAYARAIRAEADVDRKAKLLEIAHEATRSYMDLWVVQEKLSMTVRLAADAHRQMKIARQALKKGIGDSADEKVLSAQIAEFEAQKIRLLSERRTALNGFSQLAGLAVTNFSLAPPPSRRLPVDADELVEASASKASVRAILQAQREVARRALFVAQADAQAPEVTPRAVMNRDFTDNSGSLMLGVRVAIPVWNRNRAETQRARADYETADKGLEFLRQDNYRAVLINAWRAAREDQKAAEEYGDVIVPRWRAVETLAEKRLAAGQASIFDLWQAQTQVLDSENRSLAARRAAVEAVMSLETLTGTTFTQPRKKDAGHE